MKTPIRGFRYKWENTMPECEENYRSMTLTKFSFYYLLLVCNLLRLAASITANNAAVAISVSNGFVSSYLETLYRCISD
jgi:hypothetical protein